MKIISGSTTSRMAFYVESAAGEPLTLLTGFVVYRTKNGSAPVLWDTPTITEADDTNTPGLYHLLLDEDTTLSSEMQCEEMIVYITHDDMRPVVRSVDIERSYAGIDTLTALLTDLRAEPGAGAPGSEIAPMLKLDYLYKWARNKKDANGTINRFYADDGSTVDHSQGTSESIGVVTVGEMGGP